MSAVSKGKTFENFVTKQMEEMGWHIAFKSVRVRFGAIDFDGKWDIVGLKRLNDKEVQWMFVQCKSRKMYGKEKDSLAIWKRVYGFAGIICMVAYKKKVKGKVTIVWDEI
jgi:Holliday junction resolvase-like predicted endonuclease